MLRDERFDSGARRVLKRAQLEADRSGAAHLTWEHLAMALLGTPEAERVAREVALELEPHLRALRARCATLPLSNGGLAYLESGLLQLLGELDRRITDRALAMSDLASLLAEQGLVPPRSRSDGRTGSNAELLRRPTGAPSLHSGCACARRWAPTSAWRARASAHFGSWPAVWPQSTSRG